MTTKHVSEMSDKKFYTILCMILPLAVGGGVLLLTIFLPPYILSCNTNDKSCDADVSIMRLIGVGISVISSIAMFRVGHKMFKDGSELYKALDRQNDQCFTCGKIILPDDAFYWDHKSKVFCINHNPWATEESKK